MLQEILYVTQIINNIVTPIAIITLVVVTLRKKPGYSMQPVRQEAPVQRASEPVVEPVVQRNKFQEIYDEMQQKKAEEEAKHMAMLEEEARERELEMLEKQRRMDEELEAMKSRKEPVDTDIPRGL